MFELLRNDIYEQLHKSGLVVFKLLVDGDAIRLDWAPLKLVRWPPDMRALEKLLRRSLGGRYLKLFERRLFRFICLLGSL